MLHEVRASFERGGAAPGMWVRMSRSRLLSRLKASLQEVPAELLRGDIAAGKLALYCRARAQGMPV
jgi:hypothetical protein